MPVHKEIRSILLTLSSYISNMERILKGLENYGEKSRKKKAVYIAAFTT